MSCVLISFLGTGPSHGHKRGEYMHAKYRFPETGHEYESPFVADVICQEYKVDKVLLVGTMHSIWDGVYDYFTQKAGQEPDMQVWEAIYTQCQQANHASEVGEIIHHDKLEEALGKGSKAVTIHYGITADEIERNSAIILALEQYLQQGDELIIDITHSFRSLPMYIMNLLMYLQHVSEKKLKIKHICYGMLDVARELTFAPIVELKNVLQVNDWITGAYSFKRFGNADKIAELVKPIDEALSRDLSAFSDVKNLNHLAELERQSLKLRNLLESHDLPLLARQIIPPVINDFVRRLNVDANSPHQHSKFQSKLARWQFNNHNYLAAYISILEAIITYLAEEYSDRIGVDIDVYDKDEREEIKKKIKNRADISIDERWKRLYRDVSGKRNMLAHNIRRETQRGNKSVAEHFIDSLRDFLGRYDQLCQQ